MLEHLKELMAEMETALKDQLKGARELSGEMRKDGAPWWPVQSPRLLEKRLAQFLQEEAKGSQ